MATSGTSAFAATRNDLIKQAGLLVGAVRPGQSMGAGVIAEFEFALNAMVKRWQAKQLHIWTVTHGVLFPVTDQRQYSLGPSSTDHCTSSYVATELAADAALGATALTVDSITGILASDKLGIELDDGTIQWTTVSGTPTGTTVTALAVLTDTASAGNKVFAYTSNIVRPLRIVQDSAMRFNADSETESQVRVLARQDYNAITNKTQTGQVSQLYYDPQLTTGVVSLWQVPDSELDLIKFDWWRPLMDFNVAGDNPDLPQEWIDTMTFNLALARAPVYSVPTEKFAQIKMLADQYLDDVSWFDREAESTVFGVDMDDY